MCYTAIPGKTGCLVAHDVPRMPKLKKLIPVPKKKATPRGKSCGRTVKGKASSWEEEREKENRMDRNAKAKCAKRNQHHFGHARKELVKMKHAGCL